MTEQELLRQIQEMADRSARLLVESKALLSQAETMLQRLRSPHYSPAPGEVESQGIESFGRVIHGNARPDAKVNRWTVWVAGSDDFYPRLRVFNVDAGMNQELEAEMSKSTGDDEMAAAYDDYGVCVYCYSRVQHLNAMTAQSMLALCQTLNRRVKMEDE